MITKWVKAMLESYVDYGILFAIPFVLIEIIGVWVIGTPYQTFNEVLVCGGYLGVIIGCGSSLAAILTLEITSRINGEKRAEP